MASKHLEQAGIQVSNLVSNEILPRLHTPVTNGIALELFIIQRKHNLPSRYLSQWLQQLLGHAHEMPSLSTLRKSLTALSQRKQKLAKRPENTEKIEAMERTTVQQYKDKRVQEYKHRRAREQERTRELVWTSSVSPLSTRDRGHSTRDSGHMLQAEYQLPRSWSSL